ncbi:acyltransferase family protein [Psychrobacillus psychrodurans]|uniref:acyltransferase family protein n=1 Tax=Psychrobacillus psychrodurans TaxID=126157 RepID=UPI003D045865
MNNLKWLDGIRGLAALVVVVGHYLCAYYPSVFTGSVKDSHFDGLIDVRLADTPFNLFWNGYFAVSIFFVLSGFVLSTKFFSSKDYSFIVSSGIRRYVRLVIPVTFSCVIAYCLLKANLFFNEGLANYTKAYWYLPNYYNFEASFIDMLKKSLIDTFIYGVDTISYNPVLWTMKIEFFGSLLVFAMALLFGQLRNRYILYIILIWFFIDTYYVAFIFGMVLSDLYNNKTVVFVFIKNKTIKLMLLLCGLFFGSFPTVIATDKNIYSYLTFDFLGGRHGSMTIFHLIGATIIIFVVLSSKNFKKIFSHRTLLFLGEISFSMYLLHFIILFSFSGYLSIKLSRFLPYHINFILTFACSITIILIISKIFAKFVDQKGISFSKVIYEKIFKAH